MYTVHARFQPFRNVDLSELIGAVGVYVIWDARAKARPTYIGEGNVLKRFADHVERDGRCFAFPWNGYVAIISGSTHGVHKEESKAVERLLLDVAEETDRRPVVNAHPGSMSAVLLFCARETLRVVVSGHDPLLPPATSRDLTGAKEIRVRPLANGNYEVTHQWRLRRLRAPVV